MRTLLCAAIVALLGSSGLAAPATHDLDPISAIVSSTIGGTKAQTKALAKAAKTLEKTPVDLDGDLALGQSLATTLDKPFRSAPEMAAALDGALALVTADVQSARTALAGGIAATDQPGMKAAAAADLLKADAALAAVAAQKTRAAKFKALRKALAAITLGTYELPIDGTFTATLAITTNGTAGPATSYVADDLQPAFLLGQSFVIFGTTTVGVDGRFGNVTMAIHGLPKVGVYPIGNGTKTSAKYLHCPETNRGCADESWSFPQNGGSLTITEADRTRHIVAGTFQFTSTKNGALADSAAITQGSFRVSWQTLK